MKLILMFVVLAAIPTLAFATPPDVKEIEDATKNMIECAAIANEIAAMKVPEGHAKARAAAFHNTTATNPKAKIAVEPAHDQFMKDMKLRTDRLEACGKTHEANYKASEARLDFLAKADLKEEDGKAVGDRIEKYHDAKEKLEVAINALSKDRQVQSYVHKILLAHFLK